MVLRMLRGGQVTPTMPPIQGCIRAVLSSGNQQPLPKSQRDFAVESPKAEQARLQLGI